MKNAYRRWKLRRIIKALQIACEKHGLKEEVCSFAATLEATNAMAAGSKKDTELVINTTKHELAVFLSYMIQLHNSKLSLLTRARIGLVTLLIDDGKLMPRDEDGNNVHPMEFASTQFEMAKEASEREKSMRVQR